MFACFFMATIQKNKISIMRMILFFSIALMGIKFVAYYFTNSNAILSDALESIINVLAGGFALFGVYYAAKPKDKDHPYGHGKIENFSAGFEGGMIFIAGVSIIIKGIISFYSRPSVKDIDIGLILSIVAGIANYFIGSYLVSQGKKNNSILMIANGRHLISDTISSAGLVAGLLIIYLTGIEWIDYLLAIIFGFVILRTGYQLIKESITNLLDEADTQKLGELIKILNDQRRTKWIDIHNMRVLKHGANIHVDCHVTLPWYLSLEESHTEVTEVEKIITQEHGSDVEFFIHADPCIPQSCSVCLVNECKVRKQPFTQKVEWTIDNVLPNIKHSNI